MEIWRDPCPDSPGVGKMRKSLSICLVLIVTAALSSTSYAVDFTAADLKIQAIKQTLEVQLERIRSARENADNQMSLARIRIAERLRLSAEDLSRQAEILERLREQISEGSGDSQQVVNQLATDWPQLLSAAFAEINSQISQTNSLMAQMESLRDSFDDPTASDSGSATTNPQITNLPVSVSQPQPVQITTPSVPTTTTSGAT